MGLKDEIQISFVIPFVNQYHFQCFDYTRNIFGYDT